MRRKPIHSFHSLAATNANTRFEDLKAAGNANTKVYARVRGDGENPAGRWYECGEIAAADGQSLEVSGTELLALAVFVYHCRLLWA